MTSSVIDEVIGHDGQQELRSGCAALLVVLIRIRFADQ